MNHVYAVTLKRPDGRLEAYNVMAATPEESIEKAKARMKAEIDLVGSLYSVSTVLENVTS